MTRRFTSEIINEIGPEKDIPAPDVGTDASVMAWIFDTYSMNKGHSVLGVVTGKPLSIGGSLGREEATARGSLYVITDALEEEDKGLDGLRVAVQGFGNVGRHLARMLAEEGAIVVAVSDSSGGLYAPKGLDLPLVLAYKAEHGTLTGFAVRTRSRTTSFWRSSATCSRRARSSRYPRGQRRPGEGSDRLRGGERAGHAGRG